MRSFLTSMVGIQVLYARSFNCSDQGFELSAESLEILECDDWGSFLLSTLSGSVILGVVYIILCRSDTESCFWQLGFT